MTDTATCSACGCPLPADAPAGLCPKCLLAAGFESGAPSDVHLAATTPSPAASSMRFVPPSLETLAAKLPQYEFLELLGQGGMGAVYKARQRGLDRLVAIKILPAEIGHDAAFAERFAREARALAKLSYPNIVAVYDFGRTQTPVADASGSLDALFYIVMEFVDGANLRQTIRAGGMKPEQALAVVPQICDALQFAHDEGVVHRDIKPENILIDKRGRVKIADFGLAKMLGSEQLDAALTGTHQVMGTLRYMAPEQMEGTHDVDHRADIYSLGVVFYELLTGELPLGRFAAPSKKVQIDVRLDEVVLRALEKEPAQRWQHASEVKTAIAEASSHAVKPSTAPILYRRVPHEESGTTQPHLHKARIGYFIALAIALVLVFGFWPRPVRNEFATELQPTSKVYKLLTLKGEFRGTYSTFGGIQMQQAESMPLSVVLTETNGSLLEAKTTLPGRHWPSGIDVPVDAAEMLRWMKKGYTDPHDPQLEKEAAELVSLLERFSLRPPSTMDEWDSGWREDLKSFTWKNSRSIGLGAPLVVGIEAVTALGVLAALTMAYLLVAAGIRQAAAPQDKLRSAEFGYRLLLAGAVAAVYAVSFFLPAYWHRGSIANSDGTSSSFSANEPMLGWQCFAAAWDHGYPCWYANPALWLGGLTAACGWWRRTAVLGLMAAILAITVYCGQSTFLHGFWWWFTSAVVLTGGAIYAWQRFTVRASQPTGNVQVESSVPTETPTYTRWVIVPMLVLLGLWLGVSVAASARYGQPGIDYRPLDVMRTQMIGGGLVVLAVPLLLLLRWMRTLPGDVRGVLRTRLLLITATFVLGFAGLLAYFVSPWNQPHVESHGVTFVPQSKDYAALSLGLNFLSYMRTQEPYFDPDRCEVFLQVRESGELLRAAMLVELPGLVRIDGNRREPLDHGRFLAWLNGNARLTPEQPGAGAEAEELFQFLNAYHDACPRGWDSFVSIAKTYLKHYDYGEDLGTKNYIRGNPSIGFVYAFGGILGVYLLATVWAIWATARQVGTPATADPTQAARRAARKRDYALMILLIVASLGMTFGIRQLVTTAVAAFQESAQGVETHVAMRTQHFLFAGILVSLAGTVIGLVIRARRWGDGRLARVAAAMATIGAATTLVGGAWVLAIPLVATIAATLVLFLPSVQASFVPVPLPEGAIAKVRRRFAPLWFGLALLTAAVVAAAVFWKSKPETVTQPTPSVLSPPGGFSLRREGNIAYLNGHKTVVVDAVVSGDGKHLASADEQGFVVVRRVGESTANEVTHVIDRFTTNPYNSKPVHRLATTQDGGRFLISGNLVSPTIAILPFSGGNEEQVFAPTQGTISHLFSTDSDATIAYGKDGGMSFYDLKSRRETRSAQIYAHPFAGAWQSMAVAPDRKHFAVTWCTMVNMSSTAPYTMTICNTAGDVMLSWQFPTNRDWHLGQPVFTAANELVLCLPDGQMHRWKLADGKWTESKETTPSPSGWFYTSTASPDGKTIYLGTGSITQKTAPDGSKYDDFVPPYHVVAAAAETGKLLWKQELKIGPKASQQNFTARPINALVAVPGSEKVVAALFDGNLAIVEPPK